MKRSIRYMTKTVMIAALYTVATLLCAPMAYGAVQFRLSEIMVLLAYVDPLYVPGLLLGCFISNLLGIGGIVDAVFGTLASALSLLFVCLSARWFRGRQTAPGLIVASLWPSVFSFVIAFEMTMVLRSEQSFWFWTGMVAFGEFVVITVVGVPLFRYLLSKPHVVEIIKRIRN